MQGASRVRSRHCSRRAAGAGSVLANRSKARSAIRHAQPLARRVLPARPVAHSPREGVPSATSALGCLGLAASRGGVGLLPKNSMDQSWVLLVPICPAPRPGAAHWWRERGPRAEMAQPGVVDIPPPPLTRQPPYFRRSFPIWALQVAQRRCPNPWVRRARVRGGAVGSQSEHRDHH